MNSVGIKVQLFKQRQAVYFSKKKIKYTQGIQPQSKVTNVKIISAPLSSYTYDIFDKSLIPGSLFLGKKQQSSNRFLFIDKISVEALSLSARNGSLKLTNTLITMA